MLSLQHNIGAALANSIFITQKTIVMILYPPGGYFPSLEPLVEQSGGMALDWYPRDIENPYISTITESKKSFDIAMHGTDEIKPRVDDIVKRIHFAIVEKPFWFMLRFMGGEWDRRF